jgi:hypothetical protein
MVIVKANNESESGQLPSQQTLADMSNFNEQLLKAGVMLAAEGLHSSAKGVRVRFGGGNSTVIDGPFAESKEFIGGFFLVDCATRDQALALAEECPAAEWASIEVREVGPCYE